MVTCPLECFDACPTETWLQKHESVVIALTATVAAAFGLFLQCILYSRCTRISARCGCLRAELDRDVVSEADLGVP
jgi:hypothetical protein